MVAPGEEKREECRPSSRTGEVAREGWVRQQRSKGRVQIRQVDPKEEAWMSRGEGPLNLLDVSAFVPIKFYRSPLNFCRSEEKAALEEMARWERIADS